MDVGDMIIPTITTQSELLARIDAYIADHLSSRADHNMTSEEMCYKSPFSPPYFPPYDYPPGRVDCFRLSTKEARESYMVPCTDLALADYNSKNHTDYKLDDCVDVYLHMEQVGRFTLHFNFTARPGKAPAKDGDLAPKIFFAVAEYFKTDDGNKYKYKFISCCMLNDSGIKVGCDRCPDTIFHPAS